MNPQLAINIIQQHIRDHLQPPRKDWDKYYFLERCYSRWAAFELCDLLSQEEGATYLHVVAVIEGFIEKMNDYEEFSCDRSIENIFTIAREEAEEILRLFL